MIRPSDIERMVHEVTEQVLARLAADAPARERRVILLLPLASKRLPFLADRVEVWRRQRQVTVVTNQAVSTELDLLGLTSKMGKELLQIERDGIAGLLSNLEKRDVLVVGSLGFDFGRALRDLHDELPMVRIILQALLAGNPVAAVDDDLRRDLIRARSSLDGESEMLLRDLLQLGLSMTKASDLDPWMSRLEATDNALSQEVGLLLGESDIERLAQGGETRVVVGRKTVVTPLAQSRARELGLDIVRQE
jgi:hypothetical protein